ncbi:hypothetical protein CSB45_06180 [candidate division KSB3 bacterium]|uniref:DUF481 domain-containing protein n=1 Tax=candidate division KSB3 bacterium TaxID=2044937 RepID=A0A2G6E6T9_9BACT|nr:MAG: hypothetical protein CSB45_06180 [candidate division KSB3 bacterium]
MIAVCMMIFPVLTASAVSLTDYTNPDSFYKEAYVSGNFSLQSRGDNRLTDEECLGDDCESGQTSYSGTLLANYDTQYSSLPFTWLLKIDGTLDIERSAEEGADDEQGYDLTARTSVDKYYRDTKVFGFGSAETGYRKSLGADDADDPYAKIGFGAGYGRVIDATVLAKAIRVVEDLLKYDVITNDLSDDAYMQLAGIIDKEKEFESKHGPVEYEKYWFEAMEQVFREEGVLTEDALGAMGIIRIREILVNEVFSSRRYGWTVRGGLGFILSNYDGSESDPSLDLAFEYALPYVYRMQLIERLSYSTILDDDVVHQISNALSATYEVSDRIDWENLWNLVVTAPSDSDVENIISNKLSSTFRYYISNKINFDTTLSLTHLDDGIDNNGNDDLETGLFLGMTYRLR